MSTKEILFTVNVQTWSEKQITGREYDWHPGQVEVRPTTEADALLATGNFQEVVGSISSSSENASSRKQRSEAFMRGPMVVSQARADTTAYTAAAAMTLSRADGTQVLVTGSGTTAGSEPAGLFDGRPLTDGTATVYSLGFKKTASDISAPTITQSVTSANVTAAGLALFDFAAGNALPTMVSTADAMIYNRTNAYVDCVGSSIGVPPATGNSGVTNATAAPVTLPATGYAYSTALVEYDFYVEDHKFAIVGGAFGWAGFVLIDGQMAAANYVTSGATSGSGVIFDFNGVSKRRRVTVGNFAAASPQIAGVSITPQGKVTAVERSGDVMLVLGDSYNSTVAPNTAPHLAFFLKRYLGLDGLVLANVGGTGYIVKGTGNFTVGELLDAAPNRLLWPYYNPRHILINTGGNDGGQASATVKTAALAAWRSARSIFPTARITITDGNSGAAGPSANSLAIGVALAEAFVEWADPYSRFIPIVSGSASTAWITGTTNAGEALAAGNSSLWTSTDDTHPSPGGVRYLALRLTNEIDVAWAGDY